MKRKRLLKMRWQIIVGFANLGFCSRLAFFNVCKSVSPSISSFSLIEFWHAKPISHKFCVKLESVLEKIKYE